MSQNNEFVMNKNTLLKASTTLQMIDNNKTHETEKYMESDCSKIKSVLSKMINEELSNYVDETSKNNPNEIFSLNSTRIENHLFLQHVKDFKQCGIDQDKIEDEMRKTTGKPIHLRLRPIKQGIFKNTNHHCIRLEVGTPVAIALNSTMARLIKNQ